MTTAAAVLGVRKTRSSRPGEDAGADHAAGHRAQHRRITGHRTGDDDQAAVVPGHQEARCAEPPDRAEPGWVSGPGATLEDLPRQLRHRPLRRDAGSLERMLLPKFAPLGGEGDETPVLIYMGLTKDGKRASSW